MSVFRVTHVDALHTRRRMRVLACDREQAAAEVQRRFGDAWMVVVVRLAPVGVR